MSDMTTEEKILETVTTMAAFMHTDESEAALKTIVKKLDRIIECLGEIKNKMD